MNVLFLEMACSFPNGRHTQAIAADRDSIGGNESLATSQQFQRHLNSFSCTFAKPCTYDLYYIRWHIDDTASKNVY